MATTTYKDTLIGIRAITDRTDSAGTGVTNDLSAEEERYSNALFSEGWIAPSDSFEPVSGGAATWEVDLGSGVAYTDLYVVPGKAVGQGNYVVRLDQTGKTVTIDSSNVSNPRTDEIYLVVLDSAYDATGLSLPRIGYRKGDAGPSAQAPGPDPSWQAYTILASVYVPASSVDIAAATITDERVRSQSTADAPTLEGLAAGDISSAAHLHNTDYAPLAHVGSDDGHPDATVSVDGLMSAADKSKLNAIESLAEVNLSATELRTLLLTADGSGSGLDADTLDGVGNASYGHASHLHDVNYYIKSEVDALYLPKAWKPQRVVIVRTASQVITSGVELAPGMIEIEDDWGGHSGSSAAISDDDAGLYWIEATAEFAYSSAGNMRQLRVAHGSTTFMVGRKKPITSSPYSTIVRAEGFTQMTGSEAVYLYVYQDTGSNLNLLNAKLTLTQMGT